MRDFRTCYGNRAVVAGASKGLGAAFATEFAKRGMHLLPVARREGARRAVADRLRQDHAEGLWYELREQVIDVLVSCAGAISTPRYLKSTDRVFLGRIAPRTLSDGKHSVLCSGFWGVSRHVNYLGEFLMACGLALSLGWPYTLGPWLYPLYYVALLVPRERDDDRRCAKKYGPLWEQYRRRVPSRIVPGIY